jgi:hypothetical protein
MQTSLGNPAAISARSPDLGQKLCVPAFRRVCRFQRNGSSIISSACKNSLGRELIIVILMSYRGVGIGIKKFGIEAVIREQTGVEVEKG